MATTNGKWSQSVVPNSLWSMDCISHTSKVILKILQARLQHYVNEELPDVQAGFRKGRGTREQIANIWSLKKHENFRKTSASALLTMPKPLTVWITTNCGKFLKRWEYQTAWPASWEICIQVKKQQLKPHMEQWNGSKLGKDYIKAVYCHPMYLTYAEYIMWNARMDEAQVGIKIAGKNINNLRYTDDTTLMAESEEELKSLLMKLKVEIEKDGLKVNIQKIMIKTSGPITLW